MPDSIFYPLQLTYVDVDESLLIDDSFTVSYAFDTKFWTCLHDYVGNYYFATRDQSFYSLHRNNIYIHNQPNYGKFYDGVVYPTYITPTFKPATKDESRIYSFILESINYDCDFYNGEQEHNKRLLGTTFTSLSFHNSYQSSTQIPLVLVNETCTIREQWKSINIRRVRNSWFFNKIKDEAIIQNAISLNEKFDEEVSNVVRVTCGKRKRLFIDNFVIVKMLYDNQDQLSMQFSEINFDPTIVKI